MKTIILLTCLFIVSCGTIEKPQTIDEETGSYLVPAFQFEF